jgi:hypothetical protein
MPSLSKLNGSHGLGLLGAESRFSDSNRNRTVLHLAALGSTRSDQNNTFVDDSPNRYTITRTGNVAPSTFTPFGDSWSNYFDGSGDYLSLANNAAFQFGVGDFTIEMWINSPLLANYFLYDARPSSTTGFYPTVKIRAVGSVEFYTNGATKLVTASGLVAANTWAHIAVVKSSSQLRIYVNGALAGSVSDTSSYLNGASRPLIGIGGFELTEPYNGYISNVRVVKGTALYTSSFTPSKSPLTAVSGTSLLTCASNRFQDKSSNNFTITPAGNAAVKTTSPFPQAKPYVNRKTGYSVSFNGSTQRMETPASSGANGLQLGTSDFTIECWFKGKPQASNYAAILSAGQGANNPNCAWELYGDPVAGGRTVNFIMYAGNQSGPGFNLGNLLDNVWHHVAVVRSGNILYGYADGVLVATNSIPSNSQNLSYTTPITVGVHRDIGGTYYSYFSGKISNVRITKYALYNGNFTPEDSPLILASGRGLNASLLVCQSQSIRDNSYNSHTLTTSGTPVVDSDNPFNQDDELSYYFDGTGDYLSVADNAAFELGTGDFTIEAWVNSAVATKPQNNTDGSRNSQIIGKVGAYGFGFWANTSNIVGVYFSSTADGVTWTNLGGTQSLLPNAWYHIAATRQGGTLRIFIDGVLKNTGAYANNIADLTGALVIGGDGSAGTNYAFNGYVSNARITKGTALYTTDFATSRKPLPVISGTSLLTCRGRTAIDDSSSGFTVTAAGNAVSSRLSPFNSIDLYGSSYYFDGNGDYLSAPYSSAFDFGTGDFTIETWVYLIADSSLDGSNVRYAAVAACAPGNVTGQCWAFQIAGTSSTTGTGLVLEIRSTTGTLFTTSAAATIQKNVWNHISISRSSGIVRFFLNGNQIGSQATFAHSINANSQPCRIGMSNFGGTTQRYLNGKLSNLRVIKGTALYTANFTPSSSPTLTSSSLLLNSQPAIYDTTRKNVIETIGNASTAVETKGWYSGIPGVGPQSALYFDGTGDYLKIPYSPDFDFGSGDFTVEAWVMPQSGGDRAICSFGAHDGTVVATNACWTLEFSNSPNTNLRFFLYNGTTIYQIVDPATATLNSWIHVAAVRQNGTLRLFSNGIQVATTSANVSINIPAGRYLKVGEYFTIRDFQGGMHDLRVTSGFARYTANFIPPKGNLFIK